MVKISSRRPKRDGFRRRGITVNSQPGQMIIGPDGNITDVLTVEVSGGLVRTIRIVRNPDKLRHLRASAARGALVVPEIGGFRPQLGTA